MLEDIKATKARDDETIAKIDAEFRQHLRPYQDLIDEFCRESQWLAVVTLSDYPSDFLRALHVRISPHGRVMAGPYVTLSLTRRRGAFPFTTCIFNEVVIPTFDDFGHPSVKTLHWTGPRPERLRSALRSGYEAAINFPAI